MQPLRGAEIRQSSYHEPMSFLLADGWLITMNDRREILERGSVCVQNDRIAAVGFFASIMWPTISSLALNSVAENQGAFSGILCTGIAGGAVVPLLIGHLGDRFGLRSGMVLLYFTFGCVLSVGFWAKPLIKNATMQRTASTPERAFRVQGE